MFGVYSSTALQTVTNQFNIQPTSNQKVGKIALGTAAKVVVAAFAATECFLCSVASKILTNRAELKSGAKKAANVFVESAKSLNRPYAPQVREVETGNLFCRRKTIEITEGPTLTQLVGNSVKEATQHPINFVQKNPKTICIALSAAAIALYYLSQNPLPVNPSSESTNISNPNISDIKNLTPPSTYDTTDHTLDIKNSTLLLTCERIFNVSSTLRSNSTLVDNISALQPSLVDSAWKVASAVVPIGAFILAGCGVKTCYDRYNQKIKTIDIDGKLMRANPDGSRFKQEDFYFRVLGNGAQLAADREGKFFKEGKDYILLIDNSMLILANEQGDPKVIQKGKYSGNYIYVLYASELDPISKEVLYVKKFHVIDNKYKFVTDENSACIRIDQEGNPTSEVVK